MSMLVGIVLAAMSTSPEAPASIRDARIEVRPGTTPAAALAEAARDKGDSWVGWSVAAVPKPMDVCCFDLKFKRGGCSLSSEEDSWGSNDQDTHPGEGEIYVLVGTKDGTPTRMRIASPSCPIDGAGRRLLWLGPVDGGASLSVLEKLLDGKTRSLETHALAAIAYHGDPKADALLERRALDRKASKEDRQQAMFWAANARGTSGYRMVERILGSDPSGDIREHAIFALTQSDLPEAPERIRRASVEDRDADVRAQALFWLAQTKAAGAGEWIVSRLDADESGHVREQAVFALSQLEDGTDWLLDIVRSDRGVETKRRALFWLGQSDDPRAMEEIEKILNR
ncbi:MAG TPA: HEAT repeat domain-containing protein [Candidatus Polarisedimenticolaceae bacterium]|nr:HEAT repeat domain-containing protein [Candidatus Polarisedimenticolaceae bacterium]